MQQHIRLFRKQLRDHMRRMWDVRISKLEEAPVTTPSPRPHARTPTTTQQRPNSRQPSVYEMFACSVARKSTNKASRKRPTYSNAVQTQLVTHNKTLTVENPLSPLKNRRLTFGDAPNSTAFQARSRPTNPIHRDIRTLFNTTRKRQRNTSAVQTQEEQNRLSRRRTGQTTPVATTPPMRHQWEPDTGTTDTEQETQQEEYSREEEETQPTLTTTPPRNGNGTAKQNFKNSIINATKTRAPTRQGYVKCSYV
jgi:hypothetical protein